MYSTFKIWINSNCARICHTSADLMAMINREHFDAAEAQKLINKLQSIVEDIQQDFDDLNDLCN